MKSNLQALRNPFSDSARSSRTHSYYSDRSISFVSRQPKRRLESYRLRGDYERPWADDNRQKNTRYGNYIIYGFVVLGFILSALVNFLNWNKVPIHQVSLLRLNISTSANRPSIASSSTTSSRLWIQQYGLTRSRPAGLELVPLTGPRRIRQTYTLTTRASISFRL